MRPPNHFAFVFTSLACAGTLSACTWSEFNKPGYLVARDICDYYLEETWVRQFETKLSKAEAKPRKELVRLADAVKPPHLREFERPFPFFKTEEGHYAAFVLGREYREQYLTSSPANFDLWIEADRYLEVAARYTKQPKPNGLVAECTSVLGIRAAALRADMRHEEDK